MQATSVLLLTVASLAAVLGAQPEEVKTEAAAGRWNHPPHHGGYPGYWQPLVQDRFVCDLDASVLLVVDSNRHHHRGYHNGGANRAVRVKCSEVANNDEDSCNLCCQQTARRDTTLPNNKLFGFLAITKTEDDKTFTRTKRSTDDDDDDEDDDREDRRRHRNRGSFHKTDPTYVGTGKWTPDDYDTNVKCVCCAPRATAPAQSPPSYNTAAASPPSTYTAASSPSTYGSANTFGNPQPVAAAQPLVDSWQQSDSATWGAASDVPAGAPAATPAPVANSNTY